MNQELADILYEIADILEMKKVQWKPEAYRKAARALENSKSVEEIYDKKGLRGLDDIPGVGAGISKKIVQFIKTGKVKELEKLRKSVPKGVVEMMKVPGLGAKKAVKLHKKLGIRSVKDLEKAAKKHKISGLETFKEKSEENIVEGIKFMKKSREKKMLGKALPIAKEIVDELKNLKQVKKAVVGGSVRRKEETIGDIDILVVADNPKPVVKTFTSLSIVKKVLANGLTKSVIITKDNLQVDIRIIPNSSFGSALQYFTGNKSHNIHLRRIAKKKGLKLSEYGIFKGKRQVAGKTEEEVYKKLGMKYIEPELRQDNGEIEVSIKGRLPKLLNYDDIRGDLHVHTKYSDGSNSIEEMVKAAKKAGFKYVAITDHGGDMLNHINEKKLVKEIKEIDKIKKRVKGIVVLKGVEVDINADGSLAINDNILKKLDVVIASVHSGFKFSKEKQTSRILKAMDNPYVNVLGHPTNRRLGIRKTVNLDLNKIYDKAVEKKVALEINASYDRLDLNGEQVREAVKKGAKLMIGTDAHDDGQFSLMELGVAMARRGWAEQKDVINCWNLQNLRKFLKN